MDKKTLRQKYKALRQQFSDLEIEAKSLAIANNTLGLPLWDRTYFHVFMPIAHHKEIDTECLLLVLAGKDKQVVVARSDFQTRDMTHFLWTDDTRFQINNYGIPEPVSGQQVAVEDIEVVFVPLLAYDKAGHRVGYGKGFYDLFLSRCKPSTVKVGLSFFGPEEKISDTFEGDIQLDYCVTPEAVYRF